MLFAFLLSHFFLCGFVHLVFFFLNNNNNAYFKNMFEIPLKNKIFIVKNGILERKKKNFILKFFIKVGFGHFGNLLWILKIFFKLSNINLKQILNLTY
jgi:hypothetical protein